MYYPMEVQQVARAVIHPMEVQQVARGMCDPPMYYPMEVQHSFVTAKNA